MFFTKKNKSKLYDLIFKAIPVEKNTPETIMSAIENNGNKAIKDTSRHYKKVMYIMTFVKAIAIGGVLAYIGYTLRDGIGIAEITSLLMYLTAMFTTIILSFSYGEVCSKVYKNRFYLELSNFFDAFFEWEGIDFKIETTE